MRVVLLTQDDPFYLGESLEYLLGLLPADTPVVGAVLFDASPFGKRERFAAKARKTLAVFGPRFFTRYACKYLWKKVVPGKRVEQVLAARGVKVLRLADGVNHPTSLARIRELAPDLLVSVAGNQIFKRPLIDLAPRGCLNLHTALLPKYRGLMPSFWVLRHGEAETGVSVFFVDEGIDSGPILVQTAVPIGDRSLEGLIRVTKRLGMEAVAEAIRKVAAGDLQTSPNDDARMTYHSFPTRADVRAFRAAGKRFY